jgi:ribosomal protein S3AE
MAEAKIKKKKFVKIIAPKQFNEQIVGESLVPESKSLLGRKMRLNMMSLTNNPKNQNVQITLKVSALKGENVATEVHGFTLLPAFVKRLVRKDKKRVDYCFTIKTKDGKDVKVKLFMLTLNKTTKSVLTALRKGAQESLNNKASKTSFDNIISDLISNKLQSILKKELAKIYPLRQCEVRDLQLIEEKKEEELSKEAKIEKEAKEAKERKEESKSEEQKEEIKEEKPKKEKEVKEEKPVSEEKNA